MDGEFERVRKIICEQLDVSESMVTADASIIDDLGAGSIDTIELVMALESEFGIDIPEEDAESLITVDDVVRYIRSKI
ncbi:MAG TPA: acyl carrier protein [Spirochaetota bacterium]|nr:acyl carrier protein [Spirochaetota bacterium]HRZ26593.1 acyl carrier protein [Spirochaetota bacterium]HSA14194.1 acyl carrier protein [Spirochaetota bacterium]